MRRLAKEVGVEAMSLYNHVADKDDLLGGLVESVAGEIDLAEDAADWKTGTRRRAVSLHRLLARHPWAAGLWAKSTSPGDARSRFADAVLDGLGEAGFTNDLARQAYGAIQSQVVGFTMQSPKARPGTFEFGLDLILDGLERSRAGERPGSGRGRRPAASPRAGRRR